MANENKHMLNHMTAISVMKPGLLRNFTLRFMYFYVTRRLKLFFRPGYLNEIGTIHFARWVLLPKTRNLVFYSNYAGSWESYMEDFITKAAAALKADPKIGRAEALRRSMLSMITSGKDYEAHPAFWAPFVLVGEGGAGR